MQFAGKIPLFNYKITLKVKKMKYDLKVYSDHYGIFESFNSFTLEERRKIIKTLRKRGVITRWYGNFYKLATPYKVIYPEECYCECYCEDGCEGDCCVCEPMVDLGDDCIELSIYEKYAKQNLIDEGILPVLVSDDGSYPTEKELFCVDLGNKEVDLRGQIGFSFYADTERNDRLIYDRCRYSGMFKDRDFFLYCWCLNSTFIEAFADIA